jgi:hypothetical protein
MAATRIGGCLCGAVRYESEGDPLFSLQCHCRDCQRSSGTAYIAAIRVPSAGFRITRGMPKRYVAKADSGNDITRVFCGDCGSPLYVQVSTRPDIVGIRVGSLDDPSGFRPALGSHGPGIAEISHLPARAVLYADERLILRLATGDPATRRDWRAFLRAAAGAPPCPARCACL